MTSKIDRFPTSFDLLTLSLLEESKKRNSSPPSADRQKANKMKKSERNIGRFPGSMIFNILWSSIYWVSHKIQKKTWGMQTQIEKQNMIFKGNGLLLQLNKHPSRLWNKWLYTGIFIRSFLRCIQNSMCSDLFCHIL